MRKIFAEIEAHIALVSLKNTKLFDRTPLCCNLLPQPLPLPPPQGFWNRVLNFKVSGNLMSNSTAPGNRVSNFKVSGSRVSNFKVSGNRVLNFTFSGNHVLNSTVSGNRVSNF